MPFDADLETSYWAEAVNMAAHIINRLNSVLIDKTPQEVWSGEKVDLSQLKIFGSPVMVHIPKERRKKWDRKSSKLIFVGYDCDKKGYRCIEPKSKKLVVSRDVFFMEKNIEPSSIQLSDNFDEVRDVDVNIVSTNQQKSSNISGTESSTNDDDNFESFTVENDDDEDCVCVAGGEEIVEADAVLNFEEVDGDAPLLRRSTREKRARQFDDYVTYSASNNFDYFNPVSVKQAVSCDDAEHWGNWRCKMK